MDTLCKLKRLVVPIVFAAACLMPLVAHADIYRWKDAAGVEHFSNERPPAGAQVIERMREAPHDAEADRRRLADDRELRLQYRWLDVQELWARGGCTPY